MTEEVAPFLSLPDFQGLWDGAPLTARQKTIATLMLTVASNWIYRNGPKGFDLPATDADARFVVWDVVSSAIRYQKYSRMSSFNRTTAHRIDSGTFADVMKALDFTDNHKMHLGIPLAAEPLVSCEPDDFGTHGLGPGPVSFMPSHWFR
jgi:hypothetical protein